uniref:V-set and immunoglobulin domain containing 2 n=1 Tax=Erpetoichthys calabaricus TaxID=27687 RepID=A0A8C4XH02_ERPCA
MRLHLNLAPRLSQRQVHRPYQHSLSSLPPFLLSHNGTILVRCPVFGKVGSTVLLPCTYNTNFVKGCNLAWSFIPTGGSSEKEVRILYYDGEFYPVDTRRDRIRLLQSIPTQGTASIEIQSIQPSDTGSYICRVVNPNDWSGNQQGTVNLEVLSMFSFVLCYLVVQAGGLSCLISLCVNISVLYHHFTPLW